MQKSNFKARINQKVKSLIGLTSQKTAINIRFFHAFGKFPNLKTPTTFNEMINAYKLDQGFDFATYADKVAVKDFVKEKLGEEFLIPTLFAGKNLPPLEERTWKLPYIIKMNNCSGWNIFVRNESERNWAVIEKKISDWQSKVFGNDTGEAHYGKIEPQILIEEFITEKDNLSPFDYKIYVLNGKAEFLEIDMDRETNSRECYYDVNWNKMPFGVGCPIICNTEAKRPENLAMMLNFAETLAKDFPFVRVDFYEVNGKIFFGEMTFFPGAGYTRFYPDQYDKIYGEKLNYRPGNNKG
jgi:hypothetical protein